MTGIAPQKDTYKTDLNPASENIWYALATIAGTPGRDLQDVIRQKNIHYWNGYIATMIDNTAVEKLNPIKMSRLSCRFLASKI